MKLSATVGVAACLALLVGGALAVEKTMTVSRCQAILKDGKQCTNQVGKDEKFCWHHRGAVKAVNETLDDAGAGMKKGWKCTKTWSTNAWEKTKGGVREALDATEDALKDARKGWREFVGDKEKAK